MGGSADAPEGEADAAVEAAERDLREGYGEYDPEVDGEAPAPDTRPVDEG
jgi:hypothetical protein